MYSRFTTAACTSPQRKRTDKSKMPLQQPHKAKRRYNSCKKQKTNVSEHPLGFKGCQPLRDRGRESTAVQRRLWGGVGEIVGLTASAARESGEEGPWSTGLGFRPSSSHSLPAR
eukprot:2570984-Rhodomonas_salina.1